MPNFKIGDILRHKKKEYYHRLQITQIISNEYLFKFIERGGRVSGPGSDFISSVDIDWVLDVLPFNKIWRELNV